MASTQQIARPDYRELNDEEFRSTFREFLAEHVSAVKANHRDRLERARVWAALLDDNGLAAPSWPIAAGGMDLPTRLQLVYHEEMTRARAPGRPDTAMGMVGQSIIRFGTPEQQRRFLPRIRRAD